jgi:hypothetical protein
MEKGGGRGRGKWMKLNNEVKWEGGKRNGKKLGEKWRNEI